MKTDAERARQTIDALVEEAYRRALDRGEAITNPDGWRAWKRRVYVETARREGPGYLRGHYQRLGLGSAYPEPIRCGSCGASVVGNPVRKHDSDPTPYCSNACAGIPTMTLAEWLATRTEADETEFTERMRRIASRKEATA